MTEKQKVETEGSLQEMAQEANVDENTIQEALNVVEQAGNIEIEVPQKKGE